MSIDAVVRTQEEDCNTSFCDLEKDTGDYAAGNGGTPGNADGGQNFVDKREHGGIEKSCEQFECDVNDCDNNSPTIDRFERASVHRLHDAC